MRILGTVVSLPIVDLETTLRFYRDGMGFADARIDDGGIIPLELPNLSLFMIERGEFDAYSRRADRPTRLPQATTGLILSCSLASEQDVDDAVTSAVAHGGSAVRTPKREAWGHTGYVLDPDGYLWELVHSARGA